jgi:predicted membrane channel-forming protein YqfA (hemolysin III family)
MDGAHTHGHGPTGLGELVVLALGVVLAADILARVLTLLLIVLAVAGGLLLIGFIGYVVAACRRYQQATAPDAAQHHWPVVPEDSPRAVNADPVPLRQAITELHAQLLAARSGLPAADASQHQHLHFHGLTPEQAAAIIAELQAPQHTAGSQDGGSP